MDFKKAIKDKGLKQKFLAEKLEISEGLFSYYLSGDRSMPEDLKIKLKEILS